MRPISTILLFSLLYLSVNAQAPFSLSIQAFEQEGFQGVQSFVSATYEDYILLIGGRKDGLHRRQPFASFSPTGNNTVIQLLAPESGAYYQADVATLPLPLREQLQSTNMEFFQKENTLYIVGGYGYSQSQDGHITYAQLTMVDVPNLAQAMISGGDISSAFQYFADERMAVTGGYLQMLQDTFYLVGGHRFTGRYNPHDGPSFIQEYTNQVRRFTVEENDDNWAVSFYEAWTNEMQLHRRDYNLVQQVFPDGQLGLTAFSGVFQHAVNLPFLNTVDITPSGYSVNNSFEQYLNHYHCGTAPLYDESTGNMFTLFFGGMSQFYLDEMGNLQEDQEVPFVPTIGCVGRSADGSMFEESLGVLPALLGSAAEFIPAGPSIALTPDIQALHIPEAGDSTLLGYLIGGIESSAPNIFFINTGVESIASNSLFRVYLKPPAANALREISAQPTLRDFSLAPNPSKEELIARFHLSKSSAVTVTVVDVTGQIIKQWRTGSLPVGNQQMELDVSKLPAGSYWINIAARQSQSALSFIKN